MYVAWAIYKISDALKIAIIIPVFKKDNRNDCAEFGLQIYETMIRELQKYIWIIWVFPVNFWAAQIQKTDTLHVSSPHRNYNF
jgi:hypothetical protein